MASQISPGVVLRERDLSNAVIVGTSSQTAAFASTFQKGPIGEVVSISDQKDLLSVFGKPTDANAEDWFVASEFLGYGGKLAVVRAETGALNAVDSGAAVLVKNTADWEGGTGSSKKFVARGAGTLGNSLKVVVVDSGADQYVTFAATPAGIGVDDTVTFTGGATGKVLSWVPSTKTAAIVLSDPSTKLTTTDTLDIPDTGVGASVTGLAGGSGYTAGSAVATTGGSGSGLTVDVAVGAGVPNAITLTSGGSAYATGAGIATTGGGGTGLTVDVVVAGGVVQTVAINNAGTGYTVGATVTIVGGGSNATFTIDGAVGAVTGVTINAGGTGYLVGDTITVSGGGADATFDIASVTDTQIAISSVSDWYTNTEITGTGLKLSAIGPRPGTSAFAADRSLSGDEVHVAVIDTTGDVSGASSTIVERLTYLSKLSDAKSTEGGNVYYKSIINAESGYVYHGAALATTVSGAVWNAGSGSVSGALAIGGVIETDLSAGTDDYSYTAGEISAAYDEFADSENTNVNFILMGGSLGNESDTKSKAQKVIAVAAGRRDAIAFVSPFRGNQIGTSGSLTARQQKDNTLGFFSGLTSTSYAVFDSGYKYIYDRFNDVYRYIPTNGDIAGLCVSTSTALDDWFSPAGLSRGGIRNAVKLAYNPSKADRDELYQNRINPVVSISGSGITLFGDKTALASPSAFDRINVRRLFLNIEKRVENLAKGVLFELNDELTRSNFSSAVNSYLNEVQARQGLTDFLVVCDTSNNTPDVIDRNEFVAELFLKPTRSINYVTVTFTATRTGVSFAEVVGR
tara:strand:+ start:1193 stop:3592 length:2400 start_codon:yes stop_codon:yes gene_type:complete